MSIPDAVIWEITKKCNFKCAHCIVDAPLKTPPDEMKTADAFKFIDEFKAIGGKQIFFSGGEPLLRKDLEDIMKHAVNAGFSGFTIASNGSLVTEKRIASLIDAGLKSIQISIDGATPEQNAEIRGGGLKALDKALNALRIISKFPISRNAGVFLHPKNIDSLPAIIDICKKEGISLLRFSGYIPLGRGRNPDIQKSMSFTSAQIERFFEFISSYNPKRTGVSLAFDHAFGPFYNYCVCTAGKEIFYMSSNGDIYPCPSFMAEELKAGNALKEDLKTLLESNIMKSAICSPDKIEGECASCEDLTWCKGGCRGTSYAYSKRLNSSFPNCLRAVQKNFASVLQSVKPPVCFPFLEKGKQSEPIKIYKK